MPLLLIVPQNPPFVKGEWCSGLCHRLPKPHVARSLVARDARHAPMTLDPARPLRLTLLAPDIVEAVLMGEEPGGLSLTMLTKGEVRDLDRTAKGTGKALTSCGEPTCRNHLDLPGPTDSLAQYVLPDACRTIDLARPAKVPS